jgi:hypothetical protein
MTIIKKFEQDIPEGKVTKKYSAVIIIIILILVLVEVWVNNTLSIYGEKFEDLSSTEKVLNMENQILQNQIAKSESLENLASKSAELGFYKNQDIQYIR